MSGAIRAALAAMVGLLASPAQSNDPQDRPVALPAMERGQPCPVAIGTRGEVPRQPHIFGADPWFGRGPVRVGMAWKSDAGDAATFSLARVPIVAGMRRAKTPWISEPGYAGPIVVRGHALDNPRRAVLFTHAGQTPMPLLRVAAPRAPASELWSFWPSSIWIPGPGCYGLQIDTPTATDVVVFEAT